MKPLIFRFRNREGTIWWQCGRPYLDTSGPLHFGYAHTPAEAYRCWKNKHPELNLP
jgi:hypothetical protein